MTRVVAFILAALAVALLTAPAASAQGSCAPIDNFDRATGSDLGPDWDEIAGDAAIDGGKVINGSEDAALLTYLPSNADGVCATIATGPAAKPQSAYFVFRYAGADDLVLVELKDGDADGKFDTAILDSHAPATAPGAAPGGRIGNYTTVSGMTPFSSASVQVELVGTNVTVSVDAAHDGTFESAYTIHPAEPTTGVLVGFGTHLATVDDVGLSLPGPETSISTPLAEGARTANPMPALSLVSSQEGSTFTCTAATPVAPTPTGCESGLPTLTDGPWSISATAINPAGLPDLTPAELTFIVDATGPSPPEITGPDSPPRLRPGSERRTVRVAFAATDASRYECRVDDGPSLACLSPLKLRLTRGKHTLSVWAFDDLGNPSAVATRQLRVRRARSR